MFITPSTLFLARSLISFGRVGQGKWGKGLHLCIYQPLVNVIVINVIISNGSAVHGGNVGIYMYAFELNSSRVEFVNSHIVNGHAEHGGGIFIYLISQTYYHKSSHLINAANEILSFNITFEENHALKQKSTLPPTAYHFAGFSCTTTPLHAVSSCLCQ